MDLNRRGWEREARTGDPEALARVLLSRVRSGELCERRLTWAARLEHPAAKLLDLPSVDEVEAWRRVEEHDVFLGALFHACLRDWPLSVDALRTWTCDCASRAYGKCGAALDSRASTAMEFLERAAQGEGAHALARARTLSEGLLETQRALPRGGPAQEAGLWVAYALACACWREDDSPEAGAELSARSVRYAVQAAGMWALRGSVERAVSHQVQLAAHAHEREWQRARLAGLLAGELGT
jgi:hypothetical protein